MKGNSNFIVFAPHRFCKKFPPLRVLSDQKKISIKYSSFWVCDQTISAMIELLRSIRDHVDKHRKTPPDFMILFKDIPKK
jgi:hypothetical protein